jgi:hypothetical protein
LRKIGNRSELSWRRSRVDAELLDKECDAVAAGFGVERVGRVVKFELLRSADDRGIRMRALGREEVFLRCLLKKDCGWRGRGV